MTSDSGHLQDDAPHHLALGEVLEADVVHVEETLVLLGVERGVGDGIGLGGGRSLYGGSFARDGRDGLLGLLGVRHVWDETSRAWI